MSYANAKQLATSEIPVINIAALRGQDDTAIARVAARMREAAERIGFFYVSNHGIEQALIDDLFAVSRRFFLSPTELKQSVTIDALHRGWLAVGQAKMYAGAKIDLKESFLWGLELGADDPDVRAGKPLMGANRWPAELPEMRDRFYAYYLAALECGRALLRGFAVSLGRPKEFFAPAFAKPLARGSAIYYPPQPPDLGETQFGVAPHTDYGGLTLLAQDMTGGLQVLNKAGEWVTGSPIPGTLVINVGDLMARWTNNRFSSNAHRVINSSGHERLSCALFFDPHCDTVIDPRDLLDDKSQAKYPPITCGEYIVQRFNKAFQYRKDAKPG
jgi:isopenicillin N synthase-like dioxygenase